jgi:hypothetical protein
MTDENDTNSAGYWDRRFTAYAQELAEQQQLAAQHELRERRLRGVGIPFTPEPIGRPGSEVEAASLSYTASGGDIRMRSLVNGAKPYNQMHDVGADVIVKPGHSGTNKFRNGDSAGYAEYKRTGRIV